MKLTKQFLLENDNYADNDTFYIQGYFDFQSPEAKRTFIKMFGEPEFDENDGIGYHSKVVDKKKFFSIFRYSEGDPERVSLVGLKSDPYGNTPSNEFIK